MKLRIQAQHLQPGDIVGSGEIVSSVQAGVSTSKGKIKVYSKKINSVIILPIIHWDRISYWNKYTMINVEREEK